MSEIKNGGLDQYDKYKALTGSAVKGLTYWKPVKLMKKWFSVGAAVHTKELRELRCFL